MSKAKGGRYEREFVAKCDELELPAEKVPLSGALGGKYSADVLVADTWRIECKYRKEGTGFKRLYGQMSTEEFGPLELLRVEARGHVFYVYSMQAWAKRLKAELAECEPTYERFGFWETNATFATLEGWIGGADFLAVRMPRHEWLIVEMPR